MLSPYIIYQKISLHLRRSQKILHIIRVKIIYTTTKLLHNQFFKIHKLFKHGKLGNDNCKIKPETYSMRILMFCRDIWINNILWEKLSHNFQRMKEIPIDKTKYQEIWVTVV